MPEKSTMGCCGRATGDCGRIPLSVVEWHCHVWTAPADQGLFCGGAFDRGCGHVFGLFDSGHDARWP